MLALFPKHTFQKSDTLHLLYNYAVTAAWALQVIQPFAVVSPPQELQTQLIYKSN